MRRMPSRAAAGHTPTESRPASSIRYGCVHCHTVKLLNGSTMKATDDPPSSPNRRQDTREWIYAWLKIRKPTRHGYNAEFQADDDDARDMSAFLIANSTPHPETLLRLRRRYPLTRGWRQLCTENLSGLVPRSTKRAGNLVGATLPELTRVGIR